MIRAVCDDNGRRWRVEGPGWTMQPEGELTAAQAEAICKASAHAVQLGELMSAPAPAPALRVESPDLHAQFAAMSPDTPLPWDVDPAMPDSVFDAKGEEVCRLLAEDAAAAAMIVVAVNTCGGFRAKFAG